MANHTIDIQLLSTQAIAPKLISPTSIVMELYASKDTILSPDKVYSIHTDILITPPSCTYLQVTTTKLSFEETHTNPLMIETYNATNHPITIP